MRKKLALLFAFCASLLAACNNVPAPQSRTTSVSASTIGTIALEWNTQNRTATTDSSNTFTFTPLAYTDIDSPATGYRYLTMVFQIKNLKNSSFQNLTLRAIDIGNSSGTAISDMRAYPDADNPNGIAITDPFILQSITPIHGAKLATTIVPDPLGSDFQAYPASENQLDYGFVAHDPTRANPRTIVANGLSYIFVATRIPRLFTNSPKPYRFKLNFILNQDPVLQTTRGVGETTASAFARAKTLGTNNAPCQLVLVGSDTDSPTDSRVTLLRLPNARMGTAPTFLPF